MKSPVLSGAELLSLRYPRWGKESERRLGVGGNLAPDKGAAAEGGVEGEEAVQESQRLATEHIH